MATIKFIENKALRCGVVVLHHTLIVNRADSIFLNRKQPNRQLWGEWLVWDGVIGGGIVEN